jgi:NHL repeat
MKSRRPHSLRKIAGWSPSAAVAVLAAVVLAAICASTSLASEEVEVRVTTHGGPVQTEPHVYEIYWGSKWSSEPALGERPTLESLYHDISGSAWQGILMQYWSPEGFAASKAMVVGTPYSDTGEPPAEVTEANMEAEVEKVIEHKVTGWPGKLGETTVDDQFVLLTQPGTVSKTRKEACGEHISATRASYVYALIPWENSRRETCRHTFVVSHEYAEAVTDPKQSGWKNWSSGEEIADLCQNEEKQGSLNGMEVTKLASNQLYKETKGKEQCAESDAKPSQVPPEILTEGTSGVTRSEVILHGTMKPNGLDVEEYAFEWGTSIAYGERTRLEPWFGGLQKDKEVGVQLSGLLAGTTYHYRLVTYDDDTIQRGTDQKFETAAPIKPAVTTGAASDVKEGEAELSGTVNPEASETKYYFQYGLEGKEYEHNTAEESAGSGASSIEVSEHVANLTPGTTYHFRIVARNSQGTTDGGEVIFTTPIKPYTFVNAFGSEGVGSGEFEGPAGVAVNAKGGVWVLDGRDDRVEEFNEKEEFVKAFGSDGSGDGQLNEPFAIAVDGNGNIWVADTGNQRVEEFDESGEFMIAFGFGVSNGESKLEVCTSGCRAGLSGSGSGQLKNPEGLAVDSKGDVWVSDTSNSRVEEFNEKHEYVQKIGTGGEPEGLAVDAKGDVWVVNWINWIDQGVQEYNERGEAVKRFGGWGAGEGQLEGPFGIAISSGGDVWVTNQEGGDVEVFNESGEYVCQFGVKGSEAGQLKLEWPTGIALDNKGNIWITDPGNERVEKWAG